MQLLRASLLGVLALLKQTAALNYEACPDQNSAGKCSVLPCGKRRGPTDCVGGECRCKSGYCRYPASSVHVQYVRCRAQVPDSSCYHSHFCWKGGFSSSSCVQGVCLCRSHMHIGADGKCHSGWWPEVSLSLAATVNATAEEMMLAAVEEQATSDEEDGEVARNVVTGAAVLCLPLLLFGLALFLLHGGRHQPDGGTRTILVVDEEYEELPNGDAAVTTATPASSGA